MKVDETARQQGARGTLSLKSKPAPSFFTNKDPLWLHLLHTDTACWVQPSLSNLPSKVRFLVLVLSQFWKGSGYDLVPGRRESENTAVSSAVSQPTVVCFG